MMLELRDVSVNYGKVKALINLQGRNVGQTRGPLGPVNAEQEIAFRRAMERAGLL